MAQILQTEVHNNALSIPNKNQQNSIEFGFRNLNYKVKVPGYKPKHGAIPEDDKSMRTILNNISGFCPSGKMTAILGSSGAGKTSLLNILAKRIDSNKDVQLTGDLLVNSRSYTLNQFSTFASYVMQNDILFETLTPREALTFVANLKFSGQEEKERRVNDTIQALKLQRCQHSLIGGAMEKGISGGERKRVSIGIELVSDPTAILLDEPTSGLDSFTAFILLNLLRKYCQEKGKTIIFTIHQPSADIYQLFDRIMLLVEGQFIYQGSKENMINYFTSIGFECPKLSNPMDYLMSIMHTDNPINVQNIPKYFEGYQILKPRVVEEIQNSSQQIYVPSLVQTSQTYQIKQIMDRAFKNIKRDRFIVKGRLAQAIFMGLFVGGVYFGIGNKGDSPQTAQSLNGVLFFLCMNHLMQALNPVMIQFPAEREVFLREENAKMYSAATYFIGKSSMEFPFMLVIPIIQQLICYWMIGLNSNSADIIIQHFVIYFLLGICGNSLGLMAGCIFNDKKVAAGVLPLIIMPLMLFSGFFKNQGNLLNFIGWVQYLSPLKYAYEASMWNQYTDTSFQPNPINVFNFSIGQTDCMLVLVAYIVGFRILAYCFLMALKQKIQ